MSCLMLSRLKAVVGLNDPALDTGFLIRESMEDFEKRAERPASATCGRAASRRCVNSTGHSG